MRNFQSYQNSKLNNGKKNLIREIINLQNKTRNLMEIIANKSM
jgi:hypothetical protein